MLSLISCRSGADLLSALNHHWPTISRRFGSAAEQRAAAPVEIADLPISRRFTIYLSPPASRRRVGARCAWCSIFGKIGVYNNTASHFSLFSNSLISHTSLLIIGWGGTHAVEPCFPAVGRLFGFSLPWHSLTLPKESFHTLASTFWSEESLKLRRFCVSLS